MDLEYWWGELLQWLQNTPYKHELRLLVELILFAIILWRLKRERLRLEAAVGTIGQRVSAIQETVEEAPAAAPPGATAENWERIRAMWADVRERLETLIEVGVSDGRRRRKYSNLPRHSYEQVIQQLRADKILTAEVAADLIAMNSRFLGLRRARAASAAVTQDFSDRFARVEGPLSVPAPDAD